MKDVTGWIEGAPGYLTPDNERLGVLVFGACWPHIKKRLARGPIEERYIVACRFVTEHKGQPRWPVIEETTYDQSTRRWKRKRSGLGR
jgi:hypothetical protein